MNCTNHVNQASINTQFLSRKVPIPVPPLPEQTRIVAQIEKQFSRLDAGTSALRRVQANLRRYRASVLKAACEGRLVPQDSNDEPASALLNRILAERRAKWEQDLLAKGKDPKSAKYVEPQVPDTDDLPELPVGWCWSSLPQLGELARGKSKHRPRDDARLYRGPYPFIQTGDVKNSRGRITTFTQTYSEFGLAQSRLWRAGTLCITIAANIADSGILTFDSCFPDSVVGFRVEPDHAEVRFIEFFMRVAKEDLEQYAPATAQKNINVAILEKLAIPLPPLAEQNRIVNEVERRLSVVDELESIVEHNLKRADRLRQSILKRAFEGKLVPQDPADEPADVLLERIRAQRQSAPTRSNMAKDSKQLQLPLLVSHSES
ncbi:MAG: type I site-specific deoxyribonuclease [Chloroflexota bacterium]|nr:MAG: type I site-specific deoxyribonuclease [Chloroflexota bacterium]